LIESYPLPDFDWDVIAGATIGGAILANSVGFNSWQLLGRKGSLVVFAEEKDRKRVFRRGYETLIPGRNVVIVEDVTATGETIKNMAEAVNTLGGRAQAAVTVFNRGGVTAKRAGVPHLFSLLNVPLPSFEPADCPLCKEGIPIREDIGHGSPKPP
jgi:orotate phosphoribosyltransferase